jgi:hypothetical protein
MPAAVREYQPYGQFVRCDGNMITPSVDILFFRAWA